jgi:hypothetical protein
MRLASFSAAGHSSCSFVESCVAAIALEKEASIERRVTLMHLRGSASSLA